MLSGSFPKMMGILNVTPDSFYDGGSYFSLNKALEHAHKMVQDGADIVDIGGESTRPFAEPVSIAQECERVIPIIERLKNQISQPISIDSRHPEVIAAALAAGATLVNDITALQDPQAMDVVAKSQASVCLMHMQGTPQTMQEYPHYENVLQEIYDFFEARILACEKAGIARQRICIDPGFGFGKKLNHNLQLLKHLSFFNTLNCPILVGLSRKSMFGEILNKGPEERLYASLAATAIAAMQSNVIVRTHDVAATKDAMLVIKAIQQEKISS